ncbi:Endo-1,4-beta-xylanase A precursor [Enhygromyxa salina]|uniref:Endo-1,4-beta-xylanase A n=1 Tax=Enhygromyxa salina TaxID=215803 RepID=A0A0C2D334_9BACT|nr:hypothetical protein [Enhygromyxa salina]KIG16155.1 Endo-1,4-beta-xylanase A precursor [Enhygromyxa salina]
MKGTSDMRKLTLFLPLTLSIPFVLLGCQSDDVLGESGNGSDTTGDSGDGDGDGDGESGEENSGDGDGDPGDGDGDSGDGDGDSGDGDGDSGDGDGDSGDGDGDSGDGDGDTTGDGDGDAGFCAMGCEADIDCCPMGADDCPGDAYPNNWTCNGQGVCEFGGCASDDDCGGGLLDPQECHPIADLPTCFQPCTNDTDCLLQPGTTCSGIADDEAKYCAPPEAPCEADEDCEGAGICNVDTGACYCNEDANCSAEGADTCVLN